MANTNKPKGFKDGIRKTQTGWEIRVNYKTRNGAWAQKTRVIKAATRAEARQAKVRWEAELQSGNLAGTSTETVGQFIDRWLRIKAKKTDPGTLCDYESKMRFHVIPRIGGIRLDKLSSVHIERLQDELVDYRSQRTGRSLSPTTIRKILTILRIALEYARKTEKTIKANPVDDIDRIPGSVFRPNQPAPEEVAAFVRWLQQQDHNLFVAFLILTRIPCRQGEALALRWSDFDFCNRTVRITKSRTKAGRETIEKPTRKNGLDYAVDIPNGLWEALMKHKEWQQANSGNVRRLHDDGYVFTDRNGEPLPGSRLSYRWADIKRKNGWQWRLHDFRGYGTSQLLAAGVNPAEVREIGGWRDANVMYKHYAQPTIGAGRRALQALEDRTIEAGAVS